MSVDITTDGKKILVRFPYNRRDVDLVKTISGRNWHNDSKTWRLPLTMSVCRRLRQLYGERLVIAPALAIWARQEIARGEHMEELRAGWAGQDALDRLDVLAKVTPDLFAAMQNREYQVTGSVFMTEAGQVLLGDDPGLGKTLQTLATLVQKEAGSILVACPRTATRTVWERETARWAPHIKTFVAQGSRQQREDVMTAYNYWPDSPKMLIINTEMMRVKKRWECRLTDRECNSWVRVPGKQSMVPNIKIDGEWVAGWPVKDKPPGRKGGCQANHEHKVLNEEEWPFLFERNWDAIVLDESHNSLASTYNVQSNNITQVRYGAVRLRRCLRDGGLAIALSGTPARSKLPKFWGTLNWLRPDVFTSYWQFAETHFGVTEGRYGKEVGTTFLDEKEFMDSVRPYYLARTKSEVAKDLPPIQYAGTPASDNLDGPNYVWLPMEGNQAKAYRQMRDMATAYVNGGTVLANGVLAEITRLRQMACSYGQMRGSEYHPANPSNKIDWLLQFLLEREDTGGKVVVGSSFSRLVEMAATVLRTEGHKVLTLTGATTDRDRLRLVNEFADPHSPYRIAILNTRAGGEAITLDAADDLVFFDLPWTSDEAKQFVARVHRVSRIHQVTVHRLVSEGTIEAWMASLTEEQRQLVESARPEALAMLKEALR